jgi:hypothetical protein
MRKIGKIIYFCFEKIFFDARVGNIEDINT